MRPSYLTVVTVPTSPDLGDAQSYDAGGSTSSWDDPPPPAPPPKKAPAATPAPLATSPAAAPTSGAGVPITIGVVALALSAGALVWMNRTKPAPAAPRKRTA